MPKGKISWKKFEKFLIYVGCKFDREKGDHRIYKRVGLNRPIVVPQDNPLPVFVIRNNLKLLHITLEEFLNIIDMV